MRLQRQLLLAASVCAALLSACTTSQDARNDIARCNVGLDAEFGAAVEGAITQTGGRVSAAFRESIRGGFFNSTALEGETAVEAFREYVNCILTLDANERGLPPAPSGSIALYTGSTPDPFLNGVTSAKLGAKIAAGYAPQLVSTLTDGVHSIRPRMAYIEAMRSEGPILPVRPEDTYFPPPILGIAVNNTSTSPIALTSVNLTILEAKATATPWLTVTAPVVDSADNVAELTLTDAGWRGYETAQIRYTATPLSAEALRDLAPELLSDEGAFIGAFPPDPRYAILFSDFGDNAALTTTQRVEGRGFDMRKFRFEIPFPNAATQSERYAVVSGAVDLFLRNGAREEKSFVTIADFGETTRPREALYPSFAYTAFLDVNTAPAELVIPVRQQIDAQSQDYFLIAFETSEPAAVSFKATAQLTSGEEIELGEVQIETFFTNYVGANGARTAYEGPVFDEFGAP